MKNKILLLSLVGVLLLSSITFADVTIYKQGETVVHSKIVKQVWKEKYQDVRKMQLRELLGDSSTKKNTQGVSSSTPLLLPSVPSFSPVKNSLSFSNCGARKLYDVKNYEDCVSQGQQYCNVECPKRYSQYCLVCNERSLKTCQKNIVPACNLLFASRTKQLGAFYFVQDRK